jgi:hypothetical protein
MEAEVKSITVTTARPDEATGELRIGQGFRELWKESEALNKMLVFHDDSPRKVSIGITILKNEFPRAGFSFTTHSSARYEITDRTNGSLIYTTTINSEGTCPVDYAFKGIARARESINRAVQNNILQFLQALELVDIDKPMFPAKGTESP